MKRQLFGAALMVLMIALSGCGGQGAATTQTDAGGGSPSAESTAAAAQQEEAAQAITSFTVQPVEGWTLLDSASNDTFKSYNLLEPYVGSANFWIKYLGSAVFSGEEEAVRASLTSLGLSDDALVGIEKLEYHMPIVRCVANTTIQGMEFTLGHYFIDAPGEDDLYFQLSTAPGNFSKAQPLWEEALHSLATE